MIARARNWNTPQQQHHFEHSALKEPKALFDFRTDTVRFPNVVLPENGRNLARTRAISSIFEPMAHLTTFDFRSPLYIYQGGTPLTAAQAEGFSVIPDIKRGGALSRSLSRSSCHLPARHCRQRRGGQKRNDQLSCESENMKIESNIRTIGKNHSYEGRSIQLRRALFAAPGYSGSSNHRISMEVSMESKSNSDKSLSTSDSQKYTDEDIALILAARGLRSTVSQTETPRSTWAMNLGLFMLMLLSLVGILVAR